MGCEAKIRKSRRLLWPSVSEEKQREMKQRDWENESPCSTRARAQTQIFIGWKTSIKMVITVCSPRLRASVRLRILHRTGHREHRPKKNSFLLLAAWSERFRNRFHIIRLELISESSALELLLLVLLGVGVHAWTIEQSVWGGDFSEKCFRLASQLRILWCFKIIFN